MKITPEMTVMLGHAYENSHTIHDCVHAIVDAGEINDMQSHELHRISQITTGHLQELHNRVVGIPKAKVGP